MSELKCPICGEKIEHITDGWCNCKNRCTGSGSISLWQELICTRKALDVARHTIGWINQMIDEHTDKQAIKIKCEYAIDKIKQITEKE